MNKLVIPAVSAAASLEPLLRRRPLPLLPICGKALLAYQLDLASSLEVDKVIVLSDDRPEQVRQAVGEGERWGLEVEVVSVAPGLTVPAQLERAGIVDKTLLLLAGDTIVPPVEEEKRGLPKLGWIDRKGWVLMRLVGDPPARLDPGSVTGRADGWERPTCWRIDSAAAFHRAHMHVLDDDRGLVVPGFEVVPGVKVARGSKFSMTSVVEVPVIAAAEARVSHRAAIGPAVAVGSRSLVDDSAVLRNTVVMPDTYVGRLLEADGVILDGQAIIRADDGSMAMIGDDLLLADISQPVIGPRILSWLGRGIGLALAVIALPLIALAWLSARRPRWKSRRVLSHRVRYSVDGGVERVTVDLAELDTDTPLLRWMSRLADVVRGRLSLVGNPPLGEETAAVLDRALVDRWLEVPPGLFGLAQLEWLRRRGRMDSDDVAAAAALYTGSRSVSGDVSYLWRGLLLLLAPRNWRAGTVELDSARRASETMVASRATD